MSSTEVITTKDSKKNKVKELKYPAKTTFTYITGDGSQRNGNYMRTGKVVDSTDNKTYESLEKWLESLPGSPTIDKVTVQEPEIKKKEKSDLKKHQYTFDKLCPTYDMALLLFCHEQNNLDDSITTSNNKYRPGNIYAEDHNGDLVMIHYHRWKVIMARTDDAGKQLESIYFEGIGIKPDTKLYISSKYNRRTNTSGDGDKLTVYKPPFTKDNWKEYINRPTIFYISESINDEENSAILQKLNEIKSCNIINKLNYYTYNSILYACDNGKYNQLFGKCINIYKSYKYNYYNHDTRQNCSKYNYYINNYSSNLDIRGRKEYDTLDKLLEALKGAYESITI